MDWKYTGKLIIGSGRLNDENEIEYTEYSLDFLDTTYMFNDSKIAFSPDGQTGYFMALAYSTVNTTPYSIYHPVMIKTTDGGVSWSEPVHIQLGGSDGIENVKEYFSDQAIENAGYANGFNRNEVFYMMGFHFDLITDSNGNPYLTGIVAIVDEEGWYPYEGQMATWNLHSKDGGETWVADALYDNIWFEGEVGSLTVYNRPYVSASFSGDCLLFSWLDSDIDQATGNNRPNIYTIAYGSEDGYYNEIQNVTYFTQAWNKAFFGSQSYWFFTDGENDVCQLPFIFMELTVPQDETQAVNYWYINDNSIWPCPCAEMIDVSEYFWIKSSFSVSQNFPNPAANTTEVLVQSTTGQPIQIVVYTILGTTVYSEIKTSSAKVHSFKLDVSDFKKGVYFYSVTGGNKTVTKKLLVD